MGPASRAPQEVDDYVESLDRIYAATQVSAEEAPCDNPSVEQLYALGLAPGPR